MKTHPIIHEYTDIEKKDLHDFAVKISNDLTQAAINRYPIEYIGSKNYIQFKITIDGLGIDLILFGMAAIENRRLDLKRLRANNWVVKQLYAPNANVILSNILECYKAYYDCLKSGLLQLELYEMMPILDKKYKTIVSVFKEEV